jgi:hypothetical protein
LTMAASYHNPFTETPMYVELFANITIQSYCLRWCCINFLPRLVSNHEPTNLCLLSRWVDRPVPPQPSTH